MSMPIPFNGSFVTKTVVAKTRLPKSKEDRLRNSAIRPATDQIVALYLSLCSNDLMGEGNQYVSSIVYRPP